MKKIRPIVMPALAAATLLLVGMGPALAADVTDNLDIGLTVENECEMTVADVEFSSPGLSIETVVPVSDGVRMTCNQGAAYTVSAGNGLNWGMNPDFTEERSVSNGLDAIAYRLYQGIGGTVLWSSASPISGTGNGGTQLLPFTLVFYNLQDFEADRYTDSVTVTATYF